MPRCEHLLGHSFHTSLKSEDVGRALVGTGVGDADGTGVGFNVGDVVGIGVGCGVG